jgi:hypothetical protein
MAKMKLRNMKAHGVMAFICACTAMPAAAHSVRATMDAAGTSPSFTGLARVTCLNQGERPAMLVARVRDTSPPVAGLLVNLQLVKGSAAVSITDRVSGDDGYSDYIALPGGPGEYIMMVNKTAAGERSFDLEWHCMSSDNVHTETDTQILQFQ